VFPPILVQGFEAVGCDGPQFPAQLNEGDTSSDNLADTADLPKKSEAWLINQNFVSLVQTKKLRGHAYVSQIVCSI